MYEYGIFPFNFRFAQMISKISMIAWKGKENM